VCPNNRPDFVGLTINKFGENSMKKIIKQKKFVLKSVLVFLLLICCSCWTTVPTSDTTPPTFVFYVDNNGGTSNRIDITSDTSVPIRPDANLVVWAKAMDDGGMSKVVLNALADSKIVCINQDNTAATNYFENRGNVSSSTPIGNTALSELSVMDVVEGKDFYRCPEGARLLQSKLSYKATATNVHGGQTESATLTFTAPVQ
jgi:hypothetical protein